MKNKIQQEIAYLEFEISEVQYRLSKNEKVLRAYLSDADIYSIAGISSHHLLQSIQGDLALIRKYDDRKRWLLQLINDVV